MKFKVLVTDKLSDKGLEILNSDPSIQVDVALDLSPEEIVKKIGGYDALLVRSGTTVTKEIIEAASSLKVIGRAGVGVDNVDVEAASKRGIVVMNAPSGNTLSTAELTISMLMSLARSIPQAYASMKAKRWDRKKYMGTELFGKTLGIVGFGRIGREVAKRMKSFGMEIIAYDPYATADVANMLDVTIVNNLDEVYAVADFITVHTPLTEETKGIINTQAFQKMKKGVYLINCARGGIINEQDLCAALKSGQVAGAAFDVYEQEPPVENHPFYECDNMIMTPHLGASTVEAQENVAIDVAKQVVDMLVHGEVRNAVNYMQVSPEVYERLRPFMGLAENMGTLAAHLLKGRYTQIELNYCGDLSKLETSPLTVAVVKGLLKPILTDTINDVNAPVIAKERGIDITAQKNSKSDDFANLMSVTIRTEDGEEVSVSGTTFGKNDSRIVRIDGFHVDVQPSGYMLICKNVDQPGFIGRIGSILGENNINIANMTVGRKQKGEHAVTVFNVDDAIPESLLKQIKELTNIVSAVNVILA